MSIDVESIISGAQLHGEQSEPEHQVGDLEAALRAAWEVMTPEQRDRFVQDPVISEILEWGDEAAPAP